MIVRNTYSIALGGIQRGVHLSNIQRGNALNNLKKKRTISNVPPPPAYFGRVLSLDAVPYNENPNQIVFVNAGVPTVDGVYVYTQTGAPISGSMFHNTGFYGPVVSGKNNFVEFDVQYGKTGYFVGDWIENDWTYFNTGNISFVNSLIYLK